MYSFFGASVNLLWNLQFDKSPEIKTSFLTQRRSQMSGGKIAPCLLCWSCLSLCLWVMGFYLQRKHNALLTWKWWLLLRNVRRAEEKRSIRASGGDGAARGEIRWKPCGERGSDREVTQTEVSPAFAFLPWRSAPGSGATRGGYWHFGGKFHFMSM